jgi:hypothetical protein
MGITYDACCPSKYFSLHDDADTKYKVIIIKFRYSILSAISTSTGKKNRVVATLFYILQDSYAHLNENSLFIENLFPISI